MTATATIAPFMSDVALEPDVAVQEEPTIREAGQEAVGEIMGFMDRYVVFPSADHELIVATWIMHTWMFDLAQVTPYLYVSGPKASGKTRLLDVLAILSRNAERAQDMTLAVMFELIELTTPTLLIDEVDAIWSGTRNEPKRGLLNGGYKLGGCVWRHRACNLTKFSTFCPKALFGIANGYMPDTITDRSITIPMGPKPKDVSVEGFYPNRVQASGDVERVCGHIERFKDGAYIDVALARPEPIKALSDRQNEISEPLLAIASVCGLEDELRHALSMAFAGDNAQTPKQALLARIREAFGDKPRIFSEDLVSECALTSGRQLAMLLEPMGIAPRDLRIGNRVRKGYQRADFAQAFESELGEP